MEHLNTGLVIAEQTEYLLQKFSFWKGFKKGGEEGAFSCLKKKKVSFGSNAANNGIKGLETQIKWRMTPGVLPLKVVG